MRKRLNEWHSTKFGLLAFGLVGLGLAYALVSLAINSGSLWQHALALAFTVGALRNFFLLIRTYGKHDR